MSVSWLTDPRTLNILLHSLEDSNPKVVSELIGALGTIAWRYPNDTQFIHELSSILPQKTKKQPVMR